MSATVLTDERLEEIESRCEAAHPGPWTVSEDADEYEYDDHDGYGVKYITYTAIRAKRPGGGSHEVARDVHHDFNAEFIAHARRDVEVLLADVRRYRAAADEGNRALVEELAERDAELEEYREAIVEMRNLAQSLVCKIGQVFCRCKMTEEKAEQEQAEWKERIAKVFSRVAEEVRR